MYLSESFLCSGTFKAVVPISDVLGNNLSVLRPAWHALPHAARWQNMIREVRLPLWILLPLQLLLHRSHTSSFHLSDAERLLSMRAAAYCRARSAQTTFPRSTLNLRFAQLSRPKQKSSGVKGRVIRTTLADLIRDKAM